MKCEICGYQFIPWEKTDQKEHTQHCKKFLKAQRKYGNDFVNYYEGEKIKQENNPVIDDSSKDIRTRVNAAWRVLWVYYSREIRLNGYKLNFCSFKAFVPDFLYQNPSIFPADVMKELRVRYPSGARKRRKAV
ncbi:MAG: hypothetical protein A4E53_00748 [Pelotomaculum sp. PtaB.Bin104]|nr:MAG: hypothetical protein A4E53_00748 [Pelotomaculum sp. PtaB.Bin104]